MPRRSTSTAAIVLLLALVACSPADPPAAATDALPPGIIPKEDPTTFDEAVVKINASPAFFEALANQPDPGPSINLNLLRYRPRGDNSRYGLYATIAVEEILGLGGSVPFYGNTIIDIPDAIEASDEWDGIAYVVFPRRKTYLDLQERPAYQAAIPDRVAGTYERMLYVLSDGEQIYNAAHTIAGLHEAREPIPFTEGNVVLSEFLRFSKPDGRRAYEQFAAEFEQLLAEHGGEILLSVRAEMPVLSEDYWDHFVSFRFPSVEAMRDLYDDANFEALQGLRNESLEDALPVLANPGGVPSGAE